MTTSAIHEPAVSIIVVTYQSANDIEQCLKSINEHAGVSFETIVIDNASTDRTTDIVRARFTSVTLVENAENTWYTAAANAGAALARGPYLLFLNPDAVLMANALPTLVAHLEADRRVGAAGPRLVF